MNAPHLPPDRQPAEASYDDVAESRPAIGVIANPRACARREGACIAGARPPRVRPHPIPKDWFTLKKQVLVSVDRAETRVALLEASGTPAALHAQVRRPARRPGSESELAQTGAKAPDAGYRIAELYIERRGGRSIVGNIYKGKVDNVLPGLEAAFVDIGLEKNGFLHVDEIVLPGVETPKRGRGSGAGARSPTCSSPGRRSSCRSSRTP